jgi:NADP-dependent aldehyde dehydrogenase
VGNNHALLKEVFGPSTLILRWNSVDEVVALVESLEGQLTATIHASDDEITAAAPFWEALSQRVGRLLFGGFPTGVEVNHSMVHGGPYPATSNSATTSVGSRAIRRFARLLAFQSAPAALLPEELRDDNPRGIWRLLDAEWTRSPVSVSS